MKQIKKYILLLGILLSSFYLTNQSILTMRNEDVIMKQINKNSDKYIVESIDAIVKDKTIVPGKKGQTVDREKSYYQMKKYGKYNETMTVLKEVSPNISINSYYDKYIEKGNNQKRSIALVFPIKNGKTIKKIIPILEKEKIKGTFFIDGNELDSLISYIKEYSAYEYELLSFHQEYNPYYLKTAESYLENITKKEVEYCYTEKENQELLEYCSKNKHHTVKPKIVLNEELIYPIKKEIKNGLIISIQVNDNNEKELIPMIQYIKEKGYQFDTLKLLLKE